MSITQHLVSQQQQQQQHHQQQHQHHHHQQQHQLRLIHQDNLAHETVTSTGSSCSGIQAPMTNINASQQPHSFPTLQHGPMFQLPSSHHFEANHLIATNQQHQQYFQAQARVVQMLDSNQPLITHFNQHATGILECRNNEESCFATGASPYVTSAALQQQQQQNQQPEQQHQQQMQIHLNNSASDMTQSFVYNHHALGLLTNQPIDESGFISNPVARVQCSPPSSSVSNHLLSNVSQSTKSSESLCSGSNSSTSDAANHKLGLSQVSVNGNEVENGTLANNSVDNNNVADGPISNTRHMKHNNSNKSRGQKNKIVKANCLRSSQTSSLRRTFSCPTCSKSFTEKFNMKRHMQVHSQTRPKFLCNECTKSFAWKDNFIRHKRAAHSSAVSSGLRHIPV